MSLLKLKNVNFKINAWIHPTFLQWISVEIVKAQFCQFINQSYFSKQNMSCSAVDLSSISLTEIVNGNFSQHHISGQFFQYQIYGYYIQYGMSLFLPINLLSNFKYVQIWIELLVSWIIDIFAALLKLDLWVTWISG